MVVLAVVVKCRIGECRSEPSRRGGPEEHTKRLKSHGQAEIAAVRVSAIAHWPYRSLPMANITKIQRLLNDSLN